MERILIGFIALVLLLMAVLPLFGFNLRLFLGPAALVTFDPAIEPIYLFVARSAGLATAAFFAINFLRHRRPNSCCTSSCVYKLHNIFRGCLYRPDSFFSIDPSVASTISNGIEYFSFQAE
jgi:hypothetical protein